MWDKPKELTGYKGNGYENAYMHSWGAKANTALQSWKNSRSHNVVILNQDTWKNRQWKSIGVGIYGIWAVTWFGEEEDPDGYWQ